MIEKFIAAHRQEFDDTLPSEQNWIAIARRLETNSTAVPSKTVIPLTSIRPMWHRLKMAAAVLLLISASAAGGIFFAKNTTYVTNDVVLQKIAPEFREMEQYYQKEVKNGFAKLVNYKYRDETLETDFQQMEAVASDLKAELSVAPKSSREEIIQRLIGNYQARLNILKRVLSQIEGLNAPQDKIQKEQNKNKTDNEKLEI